MKQFIHQAKEFFLAGLLQRAITTILHNISAIAQDQLPMAYDLLACSYFILKNYESAKSNIDLALARQHRNSDFLISKAAILRSMGLKQQAILVLEQAQSMSQDPAINYNIFCMAQDDQEIESQRRLIHANEKFNETYDKWGGVVPSFLKVETARSSYILKEEDQAIEQILKPLPHDSKQETERLQRIKQMIEIREIQVLNYGIKLTRNAKILFPLFVRVERLYEQIMTTIEFEIEKEQHLDKLREIFTHIQALEADTETLSSTLLLNLEQQVQIHSLKEIIVFKKIDTFNESKKETVVLGDQIINATSGTDPDLQMAVTSDNILVYVNLRFLRHLSGAKSIQQIKWIQQIRNLCPENGKYLFNLLWFIGMRVIFSSQDGVDIRKYLKFRQAFNFIYSEIDEPNDFKIGDSNLEALTLRVFEKYNHIFRLPFLSGAKVETIHKNCIEYQNHISELDQTFSGILQKKECLQCLTKDPDSQQSKAEQDEFREHYGLDSKLLEDRIVENLVVIFYHFRNPQCKPYDLLLKAIIDMSIETKDTLNGRESLFRNFYEHQHQLAPEGFLLRLWKKMSS